MNTIQPTHADLTVKALGASTADPADAHLQRYLRFRGTHPGEHVALEMLDLPGSSRLRARTALALTRDPSGVLQLARDADENHQPKGVYIHQNALAVHVPARYESDRWLPLRPGDGLKAEDVCARRAFYVDLDPVRPRDVSATHAEREAAFARAGSLTAVMTEVLGDALPLGLGSSGNGIQIHVALDDLPNDAETETLIKRFLAACAAICDDRLVKVDQSVCDARRVCPAFGTTKRKGADHRGDGVPHDQARPHRTTAFVCADEVRRLTLEELAAACAELEARVPDEQRPVATVTKKASTPAKRSTGSPWDDAKDVDVERVSDWLGLGTGAAMECPGCASTQGYGRVPGTNVTKCHHDRCADKGVPGRAGTRTTVDMVAEARQVEAKQAVNLLAAEFGFEPLGGAAKKEKAPPAPPPAATGAEWEAALLRDDRDRARNATSNLELILRNDPEWSGVLGFNELRNGVVFCAPPPDGFLDRSVGDEWRDEDDVAACNWFQRRWDVYPAELRLRGVVALVAHRSSFHPIRDELRSFEWDGTGRVDTWLSKYLGVEDCEYARTVGRWWLISAVARVMDPGVKVDTMLILEGPQGLRKSSAVQALAGGDYFLEDLREVGGVEGAKQLRGKWIVELSELDAMRRAESSTIKRFLSQTRDNYRPSYGRSSVDFPRRCVFVGTTNHDDYLHDETGGRRFWPVSCGAIDLEGIRQDRGQLWAEALRLYDAGERWWPVTDAEVAMCAVEQQQRQSEDP